MALLLPLHGSSGAKPNDVFQATRSTLRPWIARLQLAGCAPIVLRGGALEPGACTFLVELSAEIAAFYSTLITAPRAGAFLSRAGPRFDLDLFQAEHQPFVLTMASNCFQNDEGDPVGRPRIEQYVARNLASTPPSEGLHVLALGLRIAEGIPARPDQRGRGRPGKDWLDAD